MSYLPTYPYILSFLKHPQQLHSCSHVSTFMSCKVVEAVNCTSKEPQCPTYIDSLKSPTNVENSDRETCYWRSSIVDMFSALIFYTSSQIKRTLKPRCIEPWGLNHNGWPPPHCESVTRVWVVNSRGVVVLGGSGTCSWTTRIPIPTLFSQWIYATWFQVVQKHEIGKKRNWQCFFGPYSLQWFLIPASCLYGE